MKSIAIFLILAFLAGFQAAVVSEQPSPSTPESNPSVLEQLQDQLEKVSTQFTEKINEGLGAVKGHTDDVLAYITELLKKHNMHKLPSRKFYYVAKDMQQYSQSIYGQSKEMLKENFKKMGDMVEEMKKHPAVTTVNEEVLDPLYKKVHGLASWASDQSITSIWNLIHKKLSN